jgi:hypothetical protein
MNNTTPTYPTYPTHTTLQVLRHLGEGHEALHEDHQPDDRHLQAVHQPEGRSGQAVGQGPALSAGDDRAVLAAERAIPGRLYTYIYMLI